MVRGRERRGGRTAAPSAESHDYVPIYSILAKGTILACWPYLEERGFGAATPVYKKDEVVILLRMGARRR